MKYSRQREMILDYICKSDAHLTADQIYEELKKEHTNLSLGTVYRNLGQLVEQGLIRKVPVAEGADRYDRTTAEHGHLLCLGCGSMMDLTLPQLQGLGDYVGDKTGFAVQHQEFLASGYCKDCQMKSI